MTGKLPSWEMAESELESNVLTPDPIIVLLKHSVLKSPHQEHEFLTLQG